MRAELLLGWACCTAGGSAAQVPFAHNDSIFLLRTFREGYHAVFIAQPQDSVWAHRTAGPVGDVTRHAYVRSQVRMLDELGIRPLAGAAGSGRWTDWVPVQRLNGAYCLYAPSDWSNHRRAQVHGTWLVTSEMDGPMVHAITGASVPADTARILAHYRCVSLVSHAMDPGDPVRDLLIHRLEDGAGVCLWEFRDSTGDSTYALMAPMHAARGLPAVVNHSPSRKAPEFQFEEPGPHLLRR